MIIIFTSLYFVLLMIFVFVSFEDNYFSFVGGVSYFSTYLIWFFLISEYCVLWSIYVFELCFDHNLVNAWACGSLFLMKMVLNLFLKIYATYIVCDVTILMKIWVLVMINTDDINSALNWMK